jgi:hypothetical protein
VFGKVFRSYYNLKDVFYYYLNFFFILNCDKNLSLRKIIIFNFFKKLLFNLNLDNQLLTWINER